MKIWMSFVQYVLFRVHQHNIIVIWKKTLGTSCYTSKMTTYDVSLNDVIMMLKICPCPSRHLPRHVANFEECFSRPPWFSFNVRTTLCSCSLSQSDALNDTSHNVKKNLLHVSMDVYWLPSASSMTLSMHMFTAWRHTAITGNVGRNVHANYAILYALNIDI